jgi:iron complex outermembrane receptor protein
MVKRKLIWALCLLPVFQAKAAFELSEADFLAEMPTVLTASRLSQPLMDAPNSTNVIDRKEIEATGYHNISDLFRLIPGMYVGQKKGWFHNVTHTLADEYARHMQVMIDGRSVYLPTIGGVRWDTLPLAIDDIERIEVVRGPNAASFGANAFTGIINIITRHPEDVTGNMLHLATGDHGHRETWYRWAGLGESSSHRITLGARQDGGMINQYDDESSRMLSYRGEFDLGAKDNLSLQFGTLVGDRGEGGVSTNDTHEQKVDSGFFQADYQLELASGQHLQAKLFFNSLKTTEDVPYPDAGLGAYYEADLLAQRWHAEFQLNSTYSSNLRSALGAYLRRDTVQSLLYWNSTKKLNVDSHGLFGHLEWRPAESWLINMGAFWEDYDLVGSRVSPRATLHWQPSLRHSFRVGVSRAYRNPVLFESSGDQRVRLLAADGSPLPFPPQPFIVSSSNVNPETMTSHEIAYFGQWPERDFTLDVRLFREQFDDFITLERPTGLSTGCPISSSTALGAKDWCNNGGSLQQGYEIQAKWKPDAEMTLMLNHAYLKIDPSMSEERYSPPHISGLHLMHGFSGGWNMSLSHYWVSGFEAIGQKAIPSYKRLDARLAKEFTVDGLNGQIALVWQNLTDTYTEFDSRNSPENLFDSRAYVHFQLDF